MEKNSYRLIGLMSGTSLDGIDLVFTEISFFDHIEYKIHLAETIPYSKEWQNKLSKAIYLDPEELNQLDKEYTSHLSKVIIDFIERHNLDLIDAICSHGHTVKHRPKKGITYQIGNRPRLAKAVGVPVVCDFRVQDVELEGQGAPLVPIGDQLLFGDYTYCINLGGFANISTQEGSDRIAYDICPVNTVLNYFARKLNMEFDEGGRLASSGELDQELLQKLNDLTYYNTKPPKSLGIEWVNSHVIPLIERSQDDVPSILKTFTVHAAMQIANCLDNNADSKLLITGGGAYNDFLINEIRSRTQCEIVIPEDQLVEFKEALVFALLGVLKLRKEINVLSSVTGARMDHSSGKIYDP
ncbi:anhydro-N-acetylmuramic acid kinase [Christiangramia salexigens]|uniref:Anhydro-N-acetylmuramic acid kinase n=1 Tax=Christiangramia salexigens TaxID=1913577 RepID=A0A1L3J7M8_9FLAO|nr:anhydro-N-acetylmuramic acid kinase [Christiangramia salexigens]APG61104.1 anhydro-N-acetylmuramic acid kinase [Christiangramia salexigens]